MTTDTLTIPTCSVCQCPVDKVITIDKSAVGGSIHYELLCHGKVVPITREAYDDLKVNRVPPVHTFENAPEFARDLMGPEHRGQPIFLEAKARHEGKGQGQGLED